MVKRPPGKTGVGLLPRHAGWSKRTTRGYHSDYDDRFRQWDDGKASGSTKDNEGATEVATVVEVEVVENRDTGITDVPSRTMPWVSRRHPCPVISAITLATEKDVVPTRLGELHRLLNNRRGSLSAT